METSDELRAFLEKATQQGVWGRLQDRGAAWSIMRREGVLPDDAPPLGDTIEVEIVGLSKVTNSVVAESWGE